MENHSQSQTNVQIIQQAFADFASGNIEGILNICTDDVLWTGLDNPMVPIAGTFNGRKELINFFTNLTDHVDYSYFEPKEFLSDKDAVIVLGHQTAKVKSTGKSFDHDWCMIFRLRDSKIYHYYIFVDTRDQAESFK